MTRKTRKWLGQGSFQVGGAMVGSPGGSLMQVFHWNRLVHNQVFSEGREQCLQSHGGSAKYQTCLIFHRPSTISCQLHFLSCPILSPSCLENLPSCLGEVPGLYLQTGHQHKLSILEMKPACRKHNRHDLDTSRQDKKSPSLQLVKVIFHGRQFVNIVNHTIKINKIRPTTYICIKKQQLLYSFIIILYLSSVFFQN